MYRAHYYLVPSRAPSLLPSIAPSKAPSIAPTFECVTLMVEVQSIMNGTANITKEHWNGHYIEDGIVKDRPKWKKDSFEDVDNAHGFIEFDDDERWVIHSGITNHELVLLDEKGLQPPTNQITIWHFYTDYNIAANVRLECSHSWAPTTGIDAICAFCMMHKL